MRLPSHRHRAGLRLPAFARELYDLRLRGLVPVQMVRVCLDSWKWGRGSARVVIPTDLDPAQTDFAFLAGLDCALVWSSKLTPMQRVDALIRALVRVEPRFLWVLDVARPERAFIVISLVNGLEIPGYGA